MKKNYRNFFPLHLISALEQTNRKLHKSVFASSSRSWLLTFSLVIAAITAYGQCSISISKVTTSGCYSVSGVSKATVSVEVAWSNAPSGQYIVVTTGTQSETIIPGTRTISYSQPPGYPNSLTGLQTIVSPQVVAFEVNANSSTASILARFSTTTSCSASGSYTAPAPCLPTVCSGNNVGGIVFKDFNDDGQKAAGETAGIPAVSVKGIACDGTVYTTTTDNYGRYSLAVPANKYPVRVEFSNVPGIYNLGVNGTDSRTTVQFVAAPSCNVNLGIFNPIDYCSNNPVVFVPCYVNGDPLVTGGNSGTSTALVTIPYGATNTTPSSDEREIARASQVGSIWGLAYNKYTKRLFQSAVLKRHAGLGPIGLGGIYVTNYTNTSSPTTTTFVNVSSLSINVGTISSNSGRLLNGDKGTANRDTPAFAQIGKVGIGDLELSEDGDKLWLVNLNDKKLYSIDISQYNTDGVTKPTAANVASFSIPASCSGGSYRPWALKVYNGKVYVGGVCDAQSSGNKSNLRASVYELNGSTFTQIFDFPLTYPKGYPANANRDITGWFPWSDDFDVVSNGGEQYYRYPVPIFTDIEFDIDGSMVLAFGDRTGLQGGDQNLRPDGTSGILYSVNSQAGDILRAYYSNGAFVLENDAKAGPSMGYGEGNSQGPGFGEFYNDNWIQDGSGSRPYYHAENVMGGLALKPGSGEVVVTTVDPVDKHPFAGGVRYLNNTTGISRASYSVYVTTGIDGNLDPGTFAKATGLGDIELGCNTIDLLQIGNRVWQDDDRDGEQDACEKGLSHVIVSLYRSGTLIARTTTDDNGEYYFPNYANPSSVTYAGSTTALVANTAYQLVFGTSGQYVNGTGVLTVSNGKYLLTTANATGGNKNDSNDSDAQVATVAGITAPVISLTTGDLGISNHTFDVGFYCQPTQYGSVSVTPASCSGNVASSNARITLNGIVNADKVFLVTAGTALSALSYTATGGQPVSASAVSFTGLANPSSSSGTSYSLVLYNGPCCYTITTALLPRTDCSCALSLSLTQPVCNPVNNQYTLTGTINLSNTPATSFTVSDGIRSTVVSATIGQTSASFSLTGLTSGTNAHTVTVFSSGTSCGTASRTYAAPNSCTVPASVTVTSASICYGSSATLIASGCSGTVTWSNGTAGTSLVVQSLTATTSYTAICATVSQTATSVGTVTVYNRPVVAIQASSTLVTVNTPVSLTALGCTGTLAWSMGGNSPVMSVTPSQASNTYSVTCTTGPGCFTTASIIVQTAPRATVQVTSATVCAGSPASLTASGCTGTLQWSGNGANSTSNVLTVATSSTITSQQVLSYTVTCTGLTSSTSAVGTVTVVPIPSLTLTASSTLVTVNTPVSLSATGCAGGTVVWSTSATGSSISVTPTLSTNVYSATCTVSPGCTKVASITVNTAPRATVQVTSATVCAGSPASLTASGCTGTLQWSGNGANSTSNVLTINTSSTITAQTVLSYTVTCTGQTSSTFAVATVTVVPIPVMAVIPPSQTIVQGQPASLTAVGCSNGVLTWSTGAIDNNNTVITVMPMSVGNTVYSVTCTVSPGCVGSASAIVSVVPTTTLTANSATVCAGSPASLTAVGCANPVQWSGQGGVQNGNVLTVATSSTIVSQQVLSFTVSCTNLGVTSSITATVTVVPIPSLTLTASATLVTVNTPVSLSAIGCAGGTVRWSTNAIGSSINVTPSQASNVYSATCTVSPGCTKVASITVNTAPPASVQVTNVTVCAGTPASLTATGCTGNLMWSGSGANNSTSTVLTINTSSTITAQQVLSYTATCTGQTSSTAAVGTITVVPQPSVTLTVSSLTVVAGSSVTLTAIGCAGTLSGNISDGATMTVVVPTVGSNVYSVTCTVQPGCSASASVIVTGVPPTTLTVMNTTVCAGSPAGLTALGCSGTVNWTGAGITSASNTSVISVSTSSASTSLQILSYTATCSALGNASVTATVTVVPTPTLSLTGIKSSTGNSMTLVAIGCSGGNVRWSTGATATSIVITPGATALYSATCTVPPSCSQTARIRVGLVPTVLDVVTSGANICAGQSVTLTASNCTADVTWSTGTTGVSLIVAPTITTGYSVTCSDDVNSAVASTTVVVSPVPTLALSASSQTLTAGNSVTLVASGCQSGTVVWSTGVNGQMSIVVSPTTNTAYSATCTTGPQCATSTSISLLVDQLPELSLTKLVNKSKAQLGDIISYTVVLANTGLGTATNVVVRDSISTGLLIVPGSMSASVGSFTVGNPISLWGIASLPANATATLTFSASATEEGVVYNRATIPGDTATVCTSIPIKVCKGTDYAVEVSAPAGYNRYQWFYRSGTAQEVMIYDGPLSSYTATAAGEYRVVVNDVQGACPNLSCCPVIIEEDSIPQFTVMAKSPTCVANQPQPNGSLTLMGLGQTPGLYTYAISEGNSFTMVNPVQLPVPTNGVIASTLNVAKTYTVRVYNMLGCYQDVTVTLEVNCECPAEICVPVVLKKTKSKVTIR